MSSATSTEKVRLKPDTTRSVGPTGGVRLQPDVEVLPDQGLQPWQFFVLAALGCATAATFLARGQGIVPILLLGLMMASAIAVGLAVLRTMRPLVSAEDDRTVMVGQRTRAALEREKHLTLRAIKELEFDRAMGKLAESDFQEMGNRLRLRAAGLMRQLDGGSGYREQIERDLAARLKPSHSGDDDTDPRSAKASAERLCGTCATPNDSDAKFCKSCGRSLSAAS
jgi:hypothetical protein